MEIKGYRGEYEREVKFDRFSLYLLIAWTLFFVSLIFEIQVSEYIPLLLLCCVNLLVSIYRYRHDKKNMVVSKLFEYTSGSIYHCFYPTSEPVEFDLKLVKEILYGRNFIIFIGDYPFAKEIFFPRKYCGRIFEITVRINSDFPDIDIKQAR